MINQVHDAAILLPGANHRGVEIGDICRLFFGLAGTGANGRNDAAMGIE
ncbi:hypothetical protein [Sphingobium sufflavum]|nr:hypothetical protein [Sphingobium sufflavum]